MAPIALASQLLEKVTAYRAMTGGSSAISTGTLLESRERGALREPGPFGALPKSDTVGPLLRPLCGLMATTLLGVGIMAAALCGTIGEAAHPAGAAPLLARANAGPTGPTTNRRARLRLRYRSGWTDVAFPLRDGMAGSGSSLTYVRLHLGAIAQQARGDPTEAGAADVNVDAGDLSPRRLSATPVAWLRPSYDLFASRRLAAPVASGAGSASLGRAVNVTTMIKSQALLPRRRQLIVAANGDTLQSLLTGIDIPDATIASIVSGLAGPQAPSPAVSPGDLVVVTAGRSKGMSVPADVSIHRPQGPTVEVARTDAGRYLPLSPGTMSGSFPSSAVVRQDKMVPPSAPISLSEALAILEQKHFLADADEHQISTLVARDFGADRLVTGADSAEMLFDGASLSKLTLAIGGDRRSYYRFIGSGDGAGRFYDEDGDAAPIAFIRKPVAGRLGDGFAWRIHPILHRPLFHEGVDFAAPFGSPIEAAAPGVVERIGWEAGYGNFVRVRHADGYATVYAHIAAPATGLRVGEHVRRGEVIAKVGSTGLSTGPHLYFELWAHGKRVDPMHAPVSIVPALSGTELENFHQEKVDLANVDNAAALMFAPSDPS